MLLAQYIKRCVFQINEEGQRFEIGILNIRDGFASADCFDVRKKFKQFFYSISSSLAEKPSNVFRTLSTNI